MAHVDVAGALRAEAPAAVGRGRLGLVVFAAGAGTLATEIAASRLLAPYFGSSTIVWANIIGLILAYLSLGYWLGGKVADRRPEPRLLGLIVLVAALFVAVTPFVARPVLDVALEGLDAVNVGAVVGSFFAALALFAIPITLLGAVSPFAIRLALVDVGEAGTVAGRLYALSTLGSILGTFLSALILIPLIGTQRTMIGSAALLVLAAALLLGLRWQLATVAVAALLLVPAGTIKPTEGLLLEEESAYQYVQVVERTDDSRALRLNEGVAVHSLWRPDTVLTGGVWDTFLVVPALLDRPVERMLVIGNAGGTIARAYGELYPDVEIDGVEIDPEVSEAGRQLLGLGDNPNLTVVEADGRPYLELTDERYDLIVVDAYHQPYIPFYLATREFFELARERLTPGGVVALNVAAVPGDERLSEAIGTTVLAAFPQAWRWKPLRFNELLLAFDRPTDEDELVARAGELDPRLSDLAGSLPGGRAPGRRRRGRAHGRPRAGRVADRPDDHRLRLTRRGARRGLPSDRSVNLRPAGGGYLRVGHRGAAALAPANTLASIAAALEVGVDGVEIDLLADEGRLRLAHSHEELTRESPALDDALALVGAAEGVFVHLDLKARGHEREIAEALGRHGLEERAVVSSFDRRALRELRAVLPHVPIGLGYPEDRLGLEPRVPPRAIAAALAAARATLPYRIGGLLRRAGAQAAMLHHLVLSPALVARCDRLGVPVFAWTVNDRATLDRVVSLGVAAVVSDDPRIFTPSGPASARLTYTIRGPCDGRSSRSSSSRPSWPLRPMRRRRRLPPRSRASPRA